MNYQYPPYPPNQWGYPQTVETPDQRLSKQMQLQQYQEYLARLQQPVSPPSTQAQNSAPVYPCRLVTSVEEVRAIQVDFSGAPSFFYSAGENKVFIKQLDLNTGMSKINSFILSEDPPKETTVKPENTYVERKDFEAFEKKFTSALEEVRKIKEEKKDEF